jgi:hypothetical protein
MATEDQIEDRAKAMHETMRADGRDHMDRIRPWEYCTDECRNLFRNLAKGDLKRRGPPLPGVTYDE